MLPIPGILEAQAAVSGVLERRVRCRLNVLSGNGNRLAVATSPGAGPCGCIRTCSGQVRLVAWSRALGPTTVRFWVHGSLEGV